VGTTTALGLITRSGFVVRKGQSSPRIIGGGWLFAFTYLLHFRSIRRWVLLGAQPSGMGHPPRQRGRTNLRAEGDVDRGVDLWYHNRGSLVLPVLSVAEGSPVEGF